MNRRELRNLSLPFGIYVEGCNVAVLIKFAIAATDQVFTAIAGDLLAVIIIPTRIFDITSVTGDCFSMEIKDGKFVAAILQLGVVELEVMISP